MLSQHASSLLLLAGVAVAVYLLMRKTRQPTELLDREPIAKSLARDRDHALQDAPAEIVQWQAEMHETARDLRAEIDTKFAALQALTILARNESQRLEAAIRRAEGLGIDAPRDTLAAIEGLADPDALADPQRLAEVAAQMPPLPRGLRGELFAENDRQVAIANLAARGLAPTEIARRLSLPIGDVELLLNLRSTATTP